ncbi:MAG: hypothetical protein ABGZ49_13765 [Akkermansiaceae bacterium]
MKFALPALVLIWSALLASAAGPAQIKRPKEEAQGNRCVSCSFAPCKCGFSPSYYTQYRTPISRVARRPTPVVPHWSRPTPSAPPRVISKEVIPSPPVPQAVPGLTLRRILSFAPSRRYSHRSRTVLNRTGTLVPTAKRPKAGPSLAPKQSLGYDPSKSWAHGGVIRRERR